MLKGERETGRGGDTRAYLRVIMEKGALDPYFIIPHPRLGLTLVIHVNHRTVHKVTGCIYFS